MILGAGAAGADLIRETLKESEAAGLEESKQPHHELPVGGLPPHFPRAERGSILQAARNGGLPFYSDKEMNPTTNQWSGKTLSLR